MTFRSIGSRDRREMSLETGVDTGDRSLVQQHFQDEVDINTIVRRFGLTREMPSGQAGGVYGDFSGISDYESALDAIRRAESGFMKLAPEVRERFGNDPSLLVRAAGELSEEDFKARLGLEQVPPVGGVPPVVAEPIV